MSFVHGSIADIHEASFVEYLLAVPYWRSWAFQHFGIPANPIYRERVPLNTAPGGPQFRGDIDVILCAPNHFEEAVVYQVKRIKVGLSQVRSKTPGKLQDLKEAVRQANLLCDIGFWKVCLYVISEIDARELNLLGDDRRHFNEIKGKIDSAIGLSMGKLNDRIGVTSFEFVQTTDSHPHTFDQSGGYLRRQAMPVSQSYELTKWVGELFTNESKVRSL